MKSFFKSNLLKKTLFFFTLSFVLVLFNLNLFEALFFNDFIPGWDGQTHFAVGKNYAENIFPSTWGWISEWYLGMPFPQFYPPAFYFFVALFSKIFFFFSYDFSFRLFVSLSLLATPILISIFAYKISKNKITAILSGLISTMFLSFHGADTNIGGSVSATINTGLFSHSLGFNFFILWLINLFDEKESKKNIFFGIIFLGLVFLTNVHLSIPALIFFLGVFLFRVLKNIKKENFKVFFIKITTKYFVYGSLSLMLSLFWLLPMIARYDYFLTSTLNVPKNIIIYFLIILCYLPFFYAIVFIVRKWEGVKLLSAIIVFLFLLIYLNIFFSFSLPLPAHVARWLTPVLYLSAIPIADFFSFLYENSQTKRSKILTTIFVIVFLGAPMYTQIFSNINNNGIYEKTKKEGFEQISNFLKTRKGLTLVESNTKKEKPTSFVLDAYLGQNGIHTVFSNLRESSMTGLYAVPLRNLFSEDPEVWGIQSFLAFNPGFLYSTPLEKKIDIAEYFSVKNIITSNPTTTKVFSRSDMEKIFETQEKDFSIFEINPDPEIVLLNSPVTAVFSEIKIKNRDSIKLSFSRLSEEWMRYFNRDIVMFKPNTKNIENNPVFNFSKVVILDDFEYKDKTKTENTITNFIKNDGIVIFVPNKKEDQEMFERIIFLLDKDKQKNLIIINKKRSAVEIYQRLLEIYKENKQKWKTENKNSITNFSFSKKTISIDLKKEAQKNTDLVLIKKSYFPDWKTQDGETYLASPSFILFVPEKKENKIVFTTSKLVYFGYTLSVLAFFGLFLWFFLGKNDKIKK